MMFMVLRQDKSIRLTIEKKLDHRRKYILSDTQ